jgi:hypothetical protein
LLLTPLKNDGVKVSWNDEIPNIWKIKNGPNHQPGFMRLNGDQLQNSAVISDQQN